MTKRNIIISVTNDLSTDQRVDKICNTLLELNFSVLLVGRILPHSKNVTRTYQTKRFKLWFNKGPLFYANYNIRLFFFLLFTKTDALWSNDLDTLWANYIVAKWKNKQLVFDSHEYFTEVPELVNRPKVQQFWKRIERNILPKLKHVLTVSPSIAELFKQEYNIDVKLLRNVPALNKNSVDVENIKIEGKKILIYQGAINVNRGIEYMVKAMQYIDNAFLYIAGYGDVSNEIEQLITSLSLQEKVKMLGEIPLEKLHGYTQQADLGLSLEEDMGLNYRFALPNKLFNYIQAELPVLVSYLPEMKNLVNQYQLGETIEKHDAKHIAEKINSMLSNEQQMNVWKANAKKAALELNWEKEKHVITNLFD
ncbi:MAG: glycosyl transferase group 1 [Flavobacteriales bacterium]|nr:MAG: glycosyl transferase group 1 [Flavobacteriales bacterium]